MVMSLSDPRILEQLSRSVESADKSSIARFIKSLALPADEESSVLGALESLPASGIRRSELSGPLAPPLMEDHNFWF